MDIKELLIYTNKEGKIDYHIKTVSAIIDGVQHCTGDVRFISNNYWAVFSNITKDNMLFTSITQNVDIGIYKSFPIKHLKYQEDHYIWVQIDLSEFKIE